MVLSFERSCSEAHIQHWTAQPAAQEGRRWATLIQHSDTLELSSQITPDMPYMMHKPGRGLTSKDLISTCAPVRSLAYVSW